MSDNQSTLSRFRAQRDQLNQSANNSITTTTAANNNNNTNIHESLNVSAITNYNGTTTSNFPIISVPDSANMSMLSTVDDTNQSYINDTINSTIDARSRIANRLRVQPTVQYTTSNNKSSSLDITRIEDKLKKIVSPWNDASMIATQSTSDDSELDKLRTVVRKLELHKSNGRATLPPINSNSIRSISTPIRVHQSPNKINTLSNVPAAPPIELQPQDIYTITDINQLQDIYDIEQQYDTQHDQLNAVNQPIAKINNDMNSNSNNNTISEAVDEMYVESRHTGEFIRIRVDSNSNQRIITGNKSMDNIESMLIQSVNHTQSRIQLISLLSLTLLIGICLLQLCILYTNTDQYEFVQSYSTISYVVHQLINILIGLCTPISMWRLLLERNDKSQNGYYSVDKLSRMRNWCIAISLCIAYLSTLIITPLDDMITYSQSIYAHQGNNIIESWMSNDITEYYVFCTIRFTFVALAWLWTIYKYVNIEKVNLQRSQEIEQLILHNNVVTQRSVDAENQQQKLLCGLSQRTPTVTA